MPDLRVPYIIIRLNFGTLTVEHGITAINPLTNKGKLSSE